MKKEFDLVQIPFFGLNQNTNTVKGKPFSYKITPNASSYFHNTESKSDYLSDLLL
jgi:hypothetical protein